MVKKKLKYYQLGLQVFVFESFKSKKAFKDTLIAEYFSILFVHIGFLRIEVNSRTIILSVNELITIPKKTACIIVNMSEEVWVSQLSFTSEFAFKNSIRWPHIGYFDFFIIKSLHKIPLKNKEVAALIDLFTLLHKKARKSYQLFGRELILFSFNLLLYELATIYDRTYGDAIIRHTANEKLAMQFFKILEINCKKQHSVKFYADTLLVSSGHLTKVIKEVADKSVKQFIEEAIVLEAKILLQNKNLTILHITEELHFSNSSFFSTFFKKHTSQSPSAYRLQLNFY